MKQGFTLVEVLIVLLLTPLILLLSLGILRNMIAHEDLGLEQFEVFKFQYRYLMQTVGNPQVVDHSIQYSYNHQTYSIYFDRNRLVKTPGYEILLFDVDQVANHEGCLSVFIKDEVFCLEP